MKNVKAYIFTAALLVFFCTGNCQKATVYFQSDRSDLDKRGKDIIDSTLVAGGFLKIILNSYCDSLGTNEYNTRLSGKRVEAVRKYLLAKNVADSLIRINPLGEISSRKQNETEDLRAKNRRVDIELVRKRLPGQITGTRPVKRKVNVSISGKVVDENAVPLVADISVNDKNGKEVHKTTSASDGSYQIRDTLISGEEYSITYVNDSTFIGTNTFVPSARGFTLSEQKVELPQLKEGKQYTLENLYFIAGEAALLNSSKPTAQALFKLMKRNKRLKIRIEGHINRPYRESADGTRTPIGYSPPGEARFDQWLSDERAKTVYDYLKNRGIAATRMSSKGFGSSKMLFPHATTEAEMSKNRRVEVFVEKVD